MDTTVAQIVRVGGGWAAGFGVTFLALTLGELLVPGERVGVTAALVVTGVGLAGFGLGSWRASRFRRLNRLYFMDHVGTEILRRRRRFEKRAGRVRNVLFAIAVAVVVAFVVLASLEDCPPYAGACYGTFAGHLGLVAASRIVGLALLAAALAAASLHRVHTAETENLELVASDALRRRDDGPIPGTKSSRWE